MLSTANKDRATLTRSMRPAFGSLYSGSSDGPTINSSAITGKASRNTEPHQKNSSRTPPTSGPIALPTEKLAIQTPIANCRCRSSWNMFRMSDRVEGASVAPAIPSSARMAISMPAESAKAASVEATAKKAAPISRSLRRPMRSPSVPMVMRKPATRNP